MYTCRLCGATFESTWSDDDAWAEAVRQFPGITPQDAAVVCEDCFVELQGWFGARERGH